MPFPPGGATDALARILGEKMTGAWKQQVVIDNRGGAGGNIAAGIAARAPADGYTIIVVGLSHAATLSLYSKLAYHPVKDFAQITQAVSIHTFLVAHPSVPVKSVKELLAVGAAQRASAMPEVPTVAEAGVPGYDVVLWFGVLAPAGTPRPIVAKLHSEMASILKLPDVNELRFHRPGADGVHHDPVAPELVRHRPASRHC